MIRHKVFEIRVPNLDCYDKIQCWRLGDRVELIKAFVHCAEKIFLLLELLLQGWYFSSQFFERFGPLIAKFFTLYIRKVCKSVILLPLLPFSYP